MLADAGLGDLTGYDCVFLCDVARLSQPEIRRLETHLRRGGGVVVSLGDQVDLGSYNEFLYRNGTGLLPARLLSRARAPAEFFFHLGADAESYRVPPLDAFGDDNDRVSLLAARFRQFVRSQPAPRGGPRKVLSFLPAAVSLYSRTARPVSEIAGDALTHPLSSSFCSAGYNEPSSTLSSSCDSVWMRCAMA